MSRVQYIVDRLRELAEKSLADRSGQFEDFASYLVTSQGRTDLDVEMPGWELYLKVLQSTSIIRPEHFASFDKKLLEFIRNWSTKNGQRVHRRTSEGDGPESKQKRRERVILEAIEKLGLDPQSLPKGASGKAGVKSQIKKTAFEIDKAAFGPNDSDKGYDNTWNPMQKAGDLKYGSRPT